MGNLIKFLLIVQFGVYFGATSLPADEGQAQRAVEQFIKTQTGPGAHRLSYDEIEKCKPLEVIKAVEKALADRTNCQAANALLFLISDNYARKQVDLPIRTEAVNMIVNYVIKYDTEVDSCIKILNKVGPDNLSPENREKLKTRFLGGKLKNYNYILFMGKLFHNPLGAETEKLLLSYASFEEPLRTERQGKYMPGSRFAAILVLARHGNDKAMELAKKYITEADKIDRYIDYVDDMVYVNRPESYMVLLENIFSNERLPGMFGQEPGPLCASDSLKVLSEKIENKDYPVTRDMDKFKLEDLEKLREWIKSQKEIKIKGCDKPIDMEKMKDAIRKAEKRPMEDPEKGIPIRPQKK